jgi:type IV pilus assembly protein PilV
MYLPLGMDFLHYSCPTHQLPTVRVKRQTLAPNGFSLLEVLISIIILSFGLLGMVGLQAAALQANRDARLQSAAVNLARELAEMMRNNKDIALLATNPYIGNFNAHPLVPATASYCGVATSTSACANTTDIANSEMTEWLSRVDNELPGSRVTVCSDSAPFDVDGIPQWTCSTGAGSSTVIKIGWTRSSTNRANNNTTPIDRATQPSVVLPVTAGSQL